MYDLNFQTELTQLADRSSLDQSNRSKRRKWGSMLLIQEHWKRMSDFLHVFNRDVYLSYPMLTLVIFIGGLDITYIITPCFVITLQCPSTVVHSPLQQLRDRQRLRAPVRMIPQMSLRPRLSLSR